jgi:hypothetical protein
VTLRASSDNIPETKVTEQNVTLAIIMVKRHVIENNLEANRTIDSFTPAFGGVPVVLMGQDGFGRPRYYGRRDLVNFLVNVPVQLIPWKQYTLN